MGCIHSKETTTAVEIRRKKKSMRERISGFILKKRNREFAAEEEKHENVEDNFADENEEIVYDSLPEESYSYSLRCEESTSSSLTSVTDISDCPEFRPLKTPSATSADTEETSSTESFSSLSDISANTWTGEVNVLPGRSTEIAGPSIGVGLAWHSYEDTATASISDEPAPLQLPPPRKDLKFKYPSYRIESYSTTSPSHAGICNDTDQDVPEYILPEETNNKSYTRASDAREASKTCQTSSRYYVAIPLTIPGAICSPPPTPPPPPSTPLQDRELNGRVDKLFDNQLQQSQSRQRVMRPKAARLPRSIPIMPTLGLPPGQDALERFAQFPQARHDQREGIDHGQEQALGIPDTTQPVPPNIPDRHSRDPRRTDGGGNNYANKDNKHRHPVRDQSRKRQKNRQHPDSGEQSKPESDGGSCCRDRDKSQRRSNRGEQSKSGSGNLSHTRDERYSSGGNGYQSPGKKHWHLDRGKGQERPDSAEYSSSDRSKNQRSLTQGEEHWYPDKGKALRYPGRGKNQSRPDSEGQRYPDRGKALRYPDRGKNQSRPDSGFQRYPDRKKALRYPERGKNQSRPDSGVHKYPDRGKALRYPDRGKALRYPDRGKNQSRPDSGAQRYPDRGNALRFPDRGKALRYPDRGKNQSRPDSGAQRYPSRGSGHRRRDRGCLDEDDEDSDNDFDWGCD